MSEITVRDTSGVYSPHHSKRRIDYLPLVIHIARPVLAQHIPDDGRLDAAVNAIADALQRFIKEMK